MKLDKNIKLVLLDRDGCVNVKAPKGQYVSTLQDFRIYPDALDFIVACINFGVHISVVTNQQGISKGAYSEADVKKIHLELMRVSKASTAQLSLYYCPHEKNTCECRKPKSGLLEEAIKGVRVQRHQVLFIGDQISDLQAARGANVNFVGLYRNEDVKFPRGTLTIRSLKEIQFEPQEKEKEN